MPNNEKDAKNASGGRLMDLVDFAKKRLRLLEKNEELENEILQLETARRKERRQHKRELSIAVLSSRAAPAPIIVGMPLVDAVAEYLACQTKPTTKKTYKGRLDHALKFFGADKDARHIEQSDLSAYAKHVLKTIPNPTTAGFYITTLGGMLNHFRIKEGWGATLTTQKLIPKKDTPDSAGRDGFTLEQMAAIFRNVARYRDGKQRHKYWVTIAAAFLGCRIEEFAQVNLHTDLQRIEGAGIWYLDLNAKPDPDGVVRKSMKNKSSWRCVPLHSSLVALGFVDYLIQERDAGFSRPFERGWGPLILKGETKPKWSHYITNWGGRELKKLEQIEGFAAVDNRLSYFHSMRHTFTQCMGRAGVSPEVCEAALGHAYAGSERERYHKLKADPEQLSRVGFEVGLGSLTKLLEGK